MIEIDIDLDRRDFLTKETLCKTHDGVDIDVLTITEKVDDLKESMKKAIVITLTEN